MPFNQPEGRLALSPFWDIRGSREAALTTLLPCPFQELKLPAFRGHSPLLKSRRFFVDILTLLSSHCQLCPTARHLAVYLLDHFLDRYNITTSKQLYAVAVSCLLLASTWKPLLPLGGRLLREPGCSQVFVCLRGFCTSSLFIPAEWELMLLVIIINIFFSIYNVPG